MNLYDELYAKFEGIGYEGSFSDWLVEQVAYFETRMGTLESRLAEMERKMAWAHFIESGSAAPPNTPITVRTTTDITTNGSVTSPGYDSPSYDPNYYPGDNPVYRNGWYTNTYRTSTYAEDGWER